MKFRIILFTALLSCVVISQAQTNVLKSGPWAGNVELRTAVIWAEVTASVRSIAVNYYPEKEPEKVKTAVYKGTLGNEFNPVKIELNGLEINTGYEYRLILNGKPCNTSFSTRFTTRDLWQYRKPAPDFIFLAGSCAYFNEPIYDRPGKPYGGDSSIFETMAKTPADFHIWMGDVWYTREVDFSTAWGLQYRASRDRGQKVLQEFMAKMPQYAIWDDHDYGPNDMGKSYILKEESREVFKKYNLNPSYGQDGKGIYTKLTYSDVDFFLTDDRYFRSEDEILDSIDEKPSAGKTFFGAMQMEWLKNALVYSKATFKIIVVGSQVLNPMSKWDCMRQFTREYNELMNFIALQKINGVLFFSGDRHHSEIIKLPRDGLYPLYDVTISPYTSGIGKAMGAETDNPYRIKNSLVEAQNFGKISITGKKGARNLHVDFLGTKGEKLAEWSISETELKIPVSD